MPKAYFFNHRLILGLFGLLVVMGQMIGCQSRAYVTDKSSDAVSISKILVLPFNDANMIATNTSDTRCPVCGRVFITGDVEAGATGFLTNHSIELLKENTDYLVVAERLSSSALSTLYSANLSAAETKQRLARRGRVNGADVVLVGFVYRFKERVGKGYGVESPASVAFDLHLIRVADGRTIWSAHFDETQKSLGDNLFRLGSFISRGGRWLTAEDLAAHGLEEIFEKFPKLGGTKPE